MATYESRRYNTPVPDASKIADGSVNNTEFQHLDGVTSDIQSQFTGKLPLAGGTMTGDLNLGDNVDINVGTGADLKILHDGSNSTIKNDTGALIVNADTLQLKNNANDETLATFANGGAANLRFNNSTKLETTNTGVSVTGELGATGNITASANVNGNGQNLTNLNASSVASGTLPMARLSGTLPALNGSALTNLNGSNISSGTLPMDRLSGTLPALNGSALTNLNGSNISSGTVADARISTLTSSKLTGALPALNGSALTSLNASNLSSGTVPVARLPAAAIGGGKVLQVVSTNSTTQFTSNASSYTDIPGMSVSITPSATNSKVLVMTDFTADTENNNTNYGFQLKRGSTSIGNGSSGNLVAHMNANEFDTMAITFLDSPSTTSATTYKLQFRSFNNGYLSFNRNQSTLVYSLASNITVIEIEA